MKNLLKYIIFFGFLLFLISCNYKPLSTLKSTFSRENIECPNILFSSEHNVYFATNNNSIDLDNLSYQAKIDNASFTAGCFSQENLFDSSLSVLFIVSPKQNTQNQILLPFYVAFINQKNELHDIQYYSVKEFFEKDSNSNEFIEVDLKETISIKGINIDNFNSIIIGFMLNEKQLKKLN